MPFGPRTSSEVYTTSRGAPNIIEAHDLAELTSLALTAPTVILAIAVVWMWAPSSIAAVRNGLATGHDWFLVGVVLGFMGSSIDNLYWSLPWSASLIGHPLSETLFESGVYFNIPFRQGLGIAAAYCHLRAAEMKLNHRDFILNRLLILSYVSALLVLSFLVMHKYR